MVKTVKKINRRGQTNNHRRTNKHHRRTNNHHSRTNNIKSKSNNSNSKIIPATQFSQKMAGYQGGPLLSLLSLPWLSQELL